MKKKIIFVTYAEGRCGTSALMGLLEKMNIFTGRSFKDIRNPRGYFEDPEYFRLIKNELPLFVNKRLQKPASIEEASLQVKNKAHLFKEYLIKAAKNHDQIALKAPRYFSIILSDLLKKEFDIYLILTSRNIEDQINSIERMWKIDISNNEEALNKRNEIRDMIYSWTDFGKSLLDAYPMVTYMETSFESLINNKIESAKDIAHFLNVTCPSDSTIEKWFEKKLVNRKKYSSSIINKLKIKIHNLLIKVKLY